MAVDEHKKRDGAVIENIGFINPQVKPTQIEVKRDRLDYWQSKGAQITPAVTKFLDAK